MVATAAPTASRLRRMNLSRAVAPRGGSRPHRLAAEMPSQVVCEFGTRRVAQRGLLGQRLQNDRVEVAAQRSREPPRASCGGDAARSRWTGRDDGQVELRRRHWLELVWALPGQQFIQHHTERIDIARDGQRLTLDLFGAGVVGRQDATDAARQLCLAGGRAHLVHQLRNAEVEQPHLAADGDEDVRGFQVAVDDKVGMRVLHRIEDLQKQAAVGPRCRGSVRRSSSRSADRPRTPSPGRAGPRRLTPAS